MLWIVLDRRSTLRIPKACQATVHSEMTQHRERHRQWIRQYLFQYGGATMTLQTILVNPRLPDDAKRLLTADKPYWYVLEQLLQARALHAQQNVKYMEDGGSDASSENESEDSDSNDSESESEADAVEEEEKKEKDDNLGYVCEHRIRNAPCLTCGPTVYYCDENKAIYTYDPMYGNVDHLEERIADHLRGKIAIVMATRHYRRLSKTQAFLAWNIPYITGSGHSFMFSEMACHITHDKNDKNSTQKKPTHSAISDTVALLPWNDNEGLKPALDRLYGEKKDEILPCLLVPTDLVDAEYRQRGRIPLDWSRFGGGNWMNELSPNAWHDAFHRSDGSQCKCLSVSDALLPVCEPYFGFELIVEHLIEHQQPIDIVLHIASNLPDNGAKYVLQWIRQRASMPILTPLLNSYLSSGSFVMKQHSVSCPVWLYNAMIL